jgi:NADPH-dependent 2,4-dienoyl-CoA reductase/sulfur reductase-like enzyme
VGRRLRYCTLDLVAVRTGLRDHEATPLGFTPTTHTATPDDHKRDYPGATSITIAITGDSDTDQLLGAQVIGHHGAEIAKRVDTYATALFHHMPVDELSDLDLAYTSPLGSPWDAVQAASRELQRHR